MRLIDADEFERTERPNYGLCYVCGKSLNLHKSLCDECLDRARKSIALLNQNPTDGMVENREYWKKSMSRRWKMERLTKRDSIYCEDICFTRGCESDECENEKEYDIYEKLRAYEDLEEQGLLLHLPAPMNGVDTFSLDGKKMWIGLPCEIGSDVYIVPSKVNFHINILTKHEENNRVYHQKVESVIFNRNGWYMQCDKDVEFGTGRILVDNLYKETWFLTKEEAESKLKEMEGKDAGSI